MERCDVLIVGGGPAGSSAAWALRDAGLDVVVLDRREFPRDKTCAGWVTPQVVESLELDLADYARGGRTLQPLHGFAVWSQNDADASYAAAISTDDAPATSRPTLTIEALIQA